MNTNIYIARVTFFGLDLVFYTTPVLSENPYNHQQHKNRRYADWFVTAVRTGKAGAGGISMMLIPRLGRSEGRVGMLWWERRCKISQEPERYLD